MPKINITEQNETSIGSFAESYDVAYVPGFVDPAKGKLEYRERRLFTSVNEFKSVCGSTPVTFARDQLYSSLPTGFAPDAVPFDGVMFREGDPDPGYVYALELLNAGLSVLYERINPDKVEITSTEKPESGTYLRQKLTLVPFTQMGQAEAEKRVFPQFMTNVEDDKTVELLEADDSVQFMLLDNNALKYVPKSNRDLIAEIKKYLQNYTDSYDPIIDANGKELGITLKVDKYTKNMPVYKTNQNLSVSTVVEGSTVDNYTSPEVFYANWKQWGMTDNIYVREDFDETFTSPYQYVSDNIHHTCTISTAYSALSELYINDEIAGLADKGNYSIKYLTSGGYPTYEYAGNTIVGNMIKLASGRGDCIALIDHTYNPDREKDINLTGSLYQSVQYCESFSNATEASYATMFTPSCKYTVASHKDPVTMPASFGYLLCLASSIKSNAPWLAIAGAARGGVPNLADGGMITVIPNGIADQMQPRESGRAVNAMTNIKPYGQTIWGNRTLKAAAGNLDATNFLSVRNLVSDVKKVCYDVARSLTFEQDNDVLWVNFKSGIASTLDRMVTGYGITGYKIVRDENHANAKDKATVCAEIYLYPVYPVEDFHINIVLSDGDVVVE